MGINAKDCFAIIAFYTRGGPKTLWNNTSILIGRLGIEMELDSEWFKLHKLDLSFQ